jgi:hypothetical protein
MKTRVAKGLGRFDFVLVRFAPVGEVECRETLVVPTSADLPVWLAGARALG